MIARMARALARFEGSLAGDVLGVVGLSLMLVMALYAPLLWGSP